MAFTFGVPLLDFNINIDPDQGTISLKQDTSLTIKHVSQILKNVFDINVSLGENKKTLKIPEDALQNIQKDNAKENYFKWLLQATFNNNFENLSLDDKNGLSITFASKETQDDFIQAAIEKGIETDQHLTSNQEDFTIELDKTALSDIESYWLGRNCEKTIFDNINQMLSDKLNYEDLPPKIFAADGLDIIYPSEDECIEFLEKTLKVNNLPKTFKKPNDIKGLEENQFKSTSGKESQNYIGNTKYRSIASNLTFTDERDNDNPAQFTALTVCAPNIMGSNYNDLTQYTDYNKTQEEHYNDYDRGSFKTKDRYGIENDSLTLNRECYNKDCEYLADFWLKSIKAQPDQKNNIDKVVVNAIGGGVYLSKVKEEDKVFARGAMLTALINAAENNKIPLDFYIWEPAKGECEMYESAFDEYKKAHGEPHCHLVKGLDMLNYIKHETANGQSVAAIVAGDTRGIGGGLDRYPARPIEEQFAHRTDLIAKACYFGDSRLIEYEIIPVSTDKCQKDNISLAKNPNGLFTNQPDDDEPREGSSVNLKR